MHDTALRHARLFFQTYAEGMTQPRILEIGSQDVNGSIRSVAPLDATYVGADFVSGKGVDVVLEDAYELPFEDGSFDLCVTSSCLEHSRFFWLSFLEIVRVVRAGGLIYLNVPSNGPFHQYPYDYWRFYPDSGLALQDWAKRNGMDAVLLESYVGPMRTGNWADLIAVFTIGGNNAKEFKKAMIDEVVNFTNGRRYSHDGIINRQVFTEDQITIHARFRRWLNSFARRPG